MAEVPTAPDRTDVVRLQVAGAQNPDVGKGVARIGADALAQLGLTPGAIVELTGKRTTAAIALPPYSADAGLDIIRLDGLLRANAGIGMGDHVEVAPAQVRPATRVVLAPAQQGVRLQGSGRALLRTLMGRPVASGDVISTSVYRQGAGPEGGNLPGMPPDLYRQLFGQQRGFGLQEIRLVVTQTAPRGIVQVTEETEIELLPEYAEPESGDGPRRHHLRRHRRTGRHGRPGARDDRAPAQAPRAVLAAGHRPAQGRAPLRPARNRQDASGEGRRQ